MTWTFIVTLAHAKLCNEKRNKTLKYFCLTFSFSYTINFSFLSHTFKLTILKLLLKTLRLLLSHFIILNFVFRFCLHGHFTLFKCILLIYFPGSVPNSHNLLTIAFSRSIPNDDTKFNYCWRSHID